MMSSKLILVQQGAPSGVPLSTVGYHFGYRFGNHYEDCLGDHYGEHFGDRFKDPFGNHFGYFLKHVEKMQKSLMYFYFWKEDCSGIVGKCAYYPTCSKETLSMLIPQFVAGEHRLFEAMSPKTFRLFLLMLLLHRHLPAKQALNSKQAANCKGYERIIQEIIRKSSFTTLNIQNRIFCSKDYNFEIASRTSIVCVLFEYSTKIWSW